jgi:hypothetical protein
MVSWSPAVPPPPVAGAAVGAGVGEASCGLGDGLGEGLGDGLAVEVALSLGEAVEVPVSEPLGLGETDPPGENEGADTLGDPEHAEASMVRLPEPSMVSVTLRPVPAIAVRTFMSPPRKAATAIPVKAADRHPDAMTRSLISRYARGTRRGRWS